MTNYQAIQTFLSSHGLKYIKPEKAGELADFMMQVKREGQEARLAFTAIATAFQRQHPQCTLARVSNWSNQAQVARPHFWVYLQQEEALSEPMFALRVYGDAAAFGISVEVSIIERKKEEHSLSLQARVLDCPAVEGSYYQYVSGDKTIRLQATEPTRANLRVAIEAGQIRKVLVKTDIAWTENMTEAELVEQLSQGMQLLLPYYAATRKK